MLKTIKKWTGSVDQRYAASLAYDGTYIYAGMYNYATSPEKAEIVKFNSNLESQATWTGGEEGTQALLYNENRIYAAFADEIAGYGAVGKFNTSLTQLDRWIGESDERSISSLDIDSTHLYAGCASSALGKVIKINKSTMAKEDRLEGAIPEFVHGIKVVGQYVYAAVLDTDAHKYFLWKINRVSMSLQVTLDPNITGFTSGGSLDYDGTYLYWGIPTAPIPTILKVNPTSFTEVSRWTGDSYPLYDTITSLYHDSGYLYAGLSTEPGKVVLINTTSMATTDLWTGVSGEDDTWEVGYFGNRIYAALLTNPAIVIKIGIAKLFAWII